MFATTQSFALRYSNHIYNKVNKIDIRFDNGFDLRNY